VHALGDVSGSETTTPTVATTASHSHAGSYSYLGVAPGGAGGGYAFDPGSDVFTLPAGGGAPFNVIQPTTYVNYMIKL
jgi:microcystin-dependent protein